MANQPIYTKRLNRIEVAVWKNETDDAVWHNITFQRAYRDNDGNVQTCSHFRMDDLPAVAFLAAKAYDFIASSDD